MDIQGMGKRVLLSAGTLLLALLFSSSATATIKCWINKDGVQECGNIVPPEYAQDEVRTLNERGLTTRIKKRAKTPEELEQERSEQEAKSAREAAEKKRQEERETHDRLILSTYSSEDELLQARDRAAASIDGIVDVTNAVIAQLNRKLDGLKKRAANLERAGKPVPIELEQDRADLERQIVEKYEHISFKEQEKTQLMDSYAADLQRYRELKNPAR